MRTEKLKRLYHSSSALIDGVPMFVQMGVRYSDMDTIAYVLLCAEGESYLELIHDPDTFNDVAVGSVLSFGAKEAKESVVHRQASELHPEHGSHKPFYVTQRVGHEATFAVIGLDDIQRVAFD